MRGSRLHQRSLPKTPLYLQSHQYHLMMYCEGAHHIDAAAEPLQDVADDGRFDDGLHCSVQQPALVVRARIPVVVTLLPLPNYGPPAQIRFF